VVNNGVMVNNGVVNKFGWKTIQFFLTHVLQLY
jgi:hypothetical protein